MTLWLLAFVAVAFLITAPAWIVHRATLWHFRRCDPHDF